MNFELKVAAEKWFHAIDFGEYQSSGRFPHPQPQNQTLISVMELLSHIDITGLTCLDIGAADGLMSFGLKMRGAEKVYAIDSYRRTTFELAGEILGLEIEYHPGTVVHTMVDYFQDTKFDIIVCAGVMYHMLNPMSAVINCRKLLKQGGLLILESAAIFDTDDAIMRFNSESSKHMKEVFTYWLPTPSAMIGMMKLASFDVLGTRKTGNLPRFCVIGRAVQPEEVANKTEVCARMLQEGISDPEFNLGQRFHLPLEPHVDIECNLPDYHKHLSVDLEVDFPPHPKSISNSLGKTIWFSKGGNW
jgi:tRNA (mo5U34)-methyltransferase